MAGAAECARSAGASTVAPYRVRDSPSSDPVRKIHLLPNLLTLGERLLRPARDLQGHRRAGATRTTTRCASTQNLSSGGLARLPRAWCFDALDGKVARMVGGGSAFGAQLDSFADMLTFGVAPAILAKILIEHEGPAWDVSSTRGSPSSAAAVFASMAILRLARFNLENDPDPRRTRASRACPRRPRPARWRRRMLMYVTLRKPQLEHVGRDPHAARARAATTCRDEPGPRAGSCRCSWVLLVALGLLMVSRVRYVHMVSAITGRGQFVTLVWSSSSRSCSCTCRRRRCSSSSTGTS